MTIALSTNGIIGTIGVNTHLDFMAYGYENISVVVNSIRYLGLENLRDSAQNPVDVTLWRQVADATGAKFIDYIASTSKADMQMNLDLVAPLAAQGILNYVEGGNEEDTAYPASLGNTLEYAAWFQQKVYAVGKQLGLPVINISFGAGWTAENNWQGNYGSVGDLSAYADYANAHTYPVPGQMPGDTIDRLNGLANLAASGRPVITTEIGWDENQGFTQAEIADYTLEAVFDGIKYGNAKTYFYGLFDDGAGKFGLMNADGTPKPAGVALHNLTTLLDDGGATAAAFTPRGLNYTLSTGDDTVLMEKSDGTFWLAVWNEHAAPHSATLTLPTTATGFKLFDPLTGTSVVKSGAAGTSFTFSVPDHPVIVEITGAAPSIGSGGGGDVTTPPADPVPDPDISIPGAQTQVVGTTKAITGIAVTDPWAASHPGKLALNVTVTGGTVAMKNAAGGLVAGSGTGAIHFSGTLEQINARLATLAYTAGNANATVTIGVWDQAGAQATETIGVTVTPRPVINIAANDADVTCNVSYAKIVAAAGDHMIFIGGSRNIVSATGGKQTIEAQQDRNRISTGKGDDTIRFAGSKNVINGGGGHNVLTDTGSNNTIVLHAANHGYDEVFGNVLTNGDKLDLRPMLAGTSWNGDTASIGKFVKMGLVGSDAVIKVNPTGVAGAAIYEVAKLHGSGPVSLDGLLAHSIT